MKKTYLIFTVLLSFFGIFYSCFEYDDNNILVTTPNLDNAERFETAQAVLDTLKNRNTEEQTFEFNNEDGITIVGDDNIKVTIQPYALIGNGTNPNIDLIGHLTEYNTPKEMFYGNVYTESNGELLITGGSFHFYVTDTEGNEMNMNPSFITSEIPIQTNVAGYENNLSYFVGDQTNVDNNQQIVNWVLSNAETSLWEGEEGDTLFNFAPTYTGFSNCDALLDIPTDQRTQFKVSFTTNSEDITIQEKTASMFVNDFPSVINIYTVDGEYLKTYENTVPLGLNATLLGIAIDSEGHLMTGTTDITVAGDDIFNIDLDYSTTEALEDLIDSISE